MKSFLHEYAKLAVVAVVASMLTFAAMHALQNPVTVRADSGSSLPPIFKKDASIGAGVSSSAASALGGKVLGVSGTWLNLTDGKDIWWINTEHPEVYYYEAK
ncbi:MAG: hypothetical protein IT462_01535 [Planctomycetes bacterium]|nr:hypothetical protein [Planctomycetota bacterium]